MSTLIVEIRSGEGGNDAKLLVEKQLGIYEKYCRRRDLLWKVIENRDGYARARVSGKGCHRAFASEAGGHRFQRVPPTEKRGRKQSSTITVAVLEDTGDCSIEIRRCDLRIENYIGEGPGGQNRNKNATNVRVTHLPSGLVACSNKKSRAHNEKMAIAEVRRRLLESKRSRQVGKRNRLRKGQIGTGMRADKVRTVAEQRGRVENHINGKRVSVKRYYRGEIDAIL